MSSVQFHAASILDCVDCAIRSLPDERQEQAQAMLRHLSDFEVIAAFNNIETEVHNDIHPLLAVLNNIVVRGLPTRASPFVEDCFREFGNKKVEDWLGGVAYEAVSCRSDDIFTALHALDNRLNLNQYSYNTSILGSDFEKSFILSKTPAWLRHLLLPQREIESIVGKDQGYYGQRVDFACEFPYCDAGKAEPNGIVCEIDGPSHKDVAVKRQDEKRDAALNGEGWSCTRIKSLEDSGEAVDRIREISFLRNVDFAYRKTLNDSNWIKHLQLALSPIGVSRIQKIIIEAILAGKLDVFSVHELKILVVEQDVPCAVMAFEEFSRMFDTLASLSRKYEFLKFPKVYLDVVSSEPFSRSPLHRIALRSTDARIYTSVDDGIRGTDYDLVIDIATMRRSGIENISLSEFRCPSRCYFNIRSSHYRRSERFIYTSGSIEYKPLVDKTAQGEYIDRTDEKELLCYFLRMLFRKENFRSGQLPIMSRALQNKCVIGLLPTGGGKSITYQLAAMLQPGVTIVVDPLLALMKDQYDGLVRLGIDTCTFINSTLESSEREARERQMEASQKQFVFLAPERLCIYGFREKLKNMHELGVYFAYGVIDEVHCVSEWGHDFRFSYLHLGKNMYRYLLPKQGDAGRRLTLLGLTATASFDVLADVERELSGDGAFELDSDIIVRDENTNRLELQYKIERVSVNFPRRSVIGTGANLPHPVNPDIDKQEFYNIKSASLLSYLPTIPDLLNQLQTDESIERIKTRFAERQNLPDIPDANLDVCLPEDFFGAAETYSHGGIVFCPHRANTGLSVDTIATNLQETVRDVGTFVGRDNRSGPLSSFGNLEKFKAGKFPIMVATKAFGMGIDKPNVRFTVNMNHSSSLESFVQEAGRAGRDRRIALATILFADYHLVRVSGDCPISKRPIPHIKRQWFYNGELQKILNYYGIRVGDEYIEHLTPENITALGVFSDPDYETVEYFYNENFKGVNSEKRTMYEILSRLPTPLFRGNRVEEETVSGFLERVLTASVDGELIAFIPFTYELEGRDGVVRKVGEADVEKAIYRMCCIGLIDDVTRDYQRKCYRIVAKRKPGGEYYRSLQKFLERYYTRERAELEIAKVPSRKGENEVYRCLGYLTEFVYEKIATKRKRAIDDMRMFCVTGLEDEDWLRANEALKDFIYYYFNSKYAREGYRTEDSNLPFSLVDDTENGKKCSYDVLFKYLRVVDDDVTGTSSPKDNIKHLQGAVRLIRRSLTDSNPALDFLNVFCLLYLKVGKNEKLQQELKRSYINGYVEFCARAEDWNDFRQRMAAYKKELTRDDRKVATESEIKLLKEWDLESELMIHSKWLTDFAKRYVER